MTPALTLFNFFLITVGGFFAGLLGSLTGLGGGGAFREEGGVEEAEEGHWRPDGAVCRTCDLSCRRGRNVLSLLMPSSL